MGAREDVLVVPRDTLFGGSEWTGFRATGLDELLARVRANYRFRPRREVEEEMRWTDAAVADAASGATEEPAKRIVDYKPAPSGSKVAGDVTPDGG